MRLPQRIANSILSLSHYRESKRDEPTATTTKKEITSIKLLALLISLTVGILYILFVAYYCWVAVAAQFPAFQNLESTRNTIADSLIVPLLRPHFPEEAKTSDNITTDEGSSVTSIVNIDNNNNSVHISITEEREKPNKYLGYQKTKANKEYGWKEHTFIEQENFRQEWNRKRLVISNEKEQWTSSFSSANNLLKFLWIVNSTMVQDVIKRQGVVSYYYYDILRLWLTDLATDEIFNPLNNNLERKIINSNTGSSSSSRRATAVAATMIESFQKFKYSILHRNQMNQSKRKALCLTMLCSALKTNAKLNTKQILNLIVWMVCSMKNLSDSQIREIQSLEATEKGIEIMAVRHRLIHFLVGQELIATSIGQLLPPPVLLLTTSYL